MVHEIFLLNLMWGKNFLFSCFLFIFSATFCSLAHNKTFCFLAIIFGVLDGEIINNTIQSFAKSNKNIIFIKSLGQKNYFNLLKHVDGVIGNSSSGICEAPSFKVGIVNIGTRQKGRLKASNIIDVNFSKKEIILAVKRIISNKFKNSKFSFKNPYSFSNTHGNLVKKIIQFLN